MSIQIITDSGSDILDSGRPDLTVLPLTISFDGEEFQDGVTLSHQGFYEKLVESEALPVTSQVSPYAFETAIRQARSRGDEVLIITLSSKLSGTWQSACIAAGEFDSGVSVVDSESVTVGQHALVEYALRLKDSGASLDTITDILNREKKQIHVLGLLDTLEYLKKGGRISKTAALAGGLLSIKPVVTVRDGEVVLLGKARGSRQGNNFLIQQIQESGVDFTRPFFLGYTGLSDALLKKYIGDSRAVWEGHTDQLQTGTVGGAIGTHVGPGAIAVAFFAARS
ncbi:MAG: DegV family protein [Eubacteriales bacterium]|nr:DegV family protein [Eubacteriales bacterium]